MSILEKKKQRVAEVVEKLEKSELVIFTDYRALSVESMNQLRNLLRIPGVEYKVIKNSILEFALKEKGYENFENELFGPNAVVFSEDNLVSPAKSVYEFAKKNKTFEIKMGILNGSVIPADKIKNLSDLPPREVLLSQLLGTMQAPITSFARVLNANIGDLARALDQLRQQKEAV